MKNANFLTLFAILSTACGDTNDGNSTKKPSQTAPEGVQCVDSPIAEVAGSATPLAQNQTLPSKVATDCAFLYWIESTVSNGSVKRVALDGSGSPQTVIEGLVYPTALTVDDSYVYVTEFSGAPLQGRVLRARSDSSTDLPDELATLQELPIAILVEGDFVYWLNRGVGETVGSVVRAHLDGSNAVPLATAQRAPLSLAKVGNTLFWSNLGSGADGSIMTATLTTQGASNVHALASDLNSPKHLAANATDVYYTTGSTGTDRLGTLVRIHLESEEAVTVADDLGDPFGVGLDEHAAYFSDVFDDIVVRMDLETLERVTVAENQGAPGQLLVAGPNLYWANEEDGRVMQMGR